MIINKRKLSKIIPTILCISFLLLPFNAFALTQSELQKQKDYYAAQAEAAKQKAAQKQQEANMVANQISSIDSQINQTELAISDTQSQINSTDKKIADLESEIKTQEENLIKQKQKMNQVVESWYMEGDSGLLEAVLGSSNISEVTTKQQYYESIKQQISGMMDQITKLKNDLISQKEEQQKQKETLQAMKDDQIARQKSLENNLAYKNELLHYTNDTINDLKNQQQQAQDRIKQIDAQIRALSATSRWGDQIVSSDDPSWYYMQTGNTTRLGNSPYTVSQYGCLITSIAMVATYYGHHVTPSDIASNPANFDSQGYLQVNSPAGTGINVGYSQPVNWNTIDDEIANGHPVIVSIYLPSVGAINRDGSSHFIVIKGKSGNKYLMHDPIGPGRGYNISQVRSMKIVRPQ